MYNIKSVFSLQLIFKQNLFKIHLDFYVKTFHNQPRS